MADTDKVTIADMSRNAHEITFADLKALLVRAGDYYLGMWQQKLIQEAIINS